MAKLSVYEEWLTMAAGDPAVYNELLSIKDDERAIEDRFFKELSFGTGGLRGKLGAGTNRMNVYSVAKATFGLADYILSKKGDGVAIAFDSRNMSKEFARLVAEIMSFKGIRAYLFDTLMPTPVLSFTVRKFKLFCGVVITASHNPKEYNGYKVYNEKGCQLTDGAAAEVTRFIEGYGYFNEFTPREELITVIGEEVLDEFIDAVMEYSLPFDKKYLPSVVYTPLCGTGNIPVQKLFSRLGIKDYVIVPEQREPDGNFTTCPFPNPEEKSALTLALDLAKEKGAELVLATDPDADRVGIAVKDGDDYRLLNGNETGILMENFILSVLKKENRTPEKAYVVKTVVTSDLAERVANSFGVSVKNVLTGFKYIGETIDKYTDENYVFGMEESYGYLVGRHVRDKDAISAVMIIVEMFSFYAENGGTVLSALEDLYDRFGHFNSALYYKVFEGKSGMEYMKNFTENLRLAPWKDVAGEKVLSVTDYKKGIDGLPKSDVLVFSGDRFSLVVRPSGTEPKLKVYVTAKGKTREESLILNDKILDFIKGKM